MGTTVLELVERLAVLEACLTSVLRWIVSAVAVVAKFADICMALHDPSFEAMHV